MAKSSATKERWKAEGLKVIYTHGRKANVLSIISNLGSADLYRYAYFGHGGIGYLTQIRDNRELSPGEEFSRGIVIPKKYTLYGISEMSIYACSSSDEYEKWASNVSFRGDLVLVNGPFDSLSPLRDYSLMNAYGTAR